MTLFEKSSIILTPTAYDNGSINTVKPEYKILPQELVTNGTFDTDLSGWSIINSDATHTVTHTFDGARFQSDTTSPILFFQTNDNVLQGGKKYLLTVEIVSLNSGSAKIQGNGVEVFFSENGVFSNIVKPTSNTPVKFYRNTFDVDLTIKSVSVKEIQEADFDFSRGSSATRVNEQGVIEEVASGIPRIDYTSGQGALLLEPQSTNLITYSEDFSDSSWSKSRVTIISNDTTSPDGSVNASKLSANTQDSTHELDFSFSFTDNDFAFSVFAKKEELDKLTLFYTVINKAATFDLTNGTITSASFGSLPSKVEMVDYGSGWYRCSITDNTNGVSQCRIRLGSGGLFAGNDIDGVYIYGAQLEQGSYATSYIPTNGELGGVTRSADVANNSGNADLFNDSEGVLYANIAALANDGTFRFISLSDGTSSNRISLFFSTSNTLNAAASDVSSIGGVSGIENNNKVAFKYKSGDYALWVNGIEVGTSTVTTGNHTNLNRLNFDFGQGSNDFYGNVKSVAVFKEALTDAELESLTSWISFTQMANDLEYTIE